MKRVILALLLAAGCASAPTPQPAAPPSAVDEAWLIEFGSSASVLCRRFEREVLSLPEVRTALTKVAFETYDLATSSGREAAARIVVRPISPSFFILDGPRRHVLAAHVGGLDADAFVRFIEQAADSGGTEAALLDALAAQPDDPRVLLRAARWYRAHGRDAQALALYDRVTDDTEAFAVLRDDAGWEGLCLRYRQPGLRRDPHRLVDYVRDHPSSDHFWTGMYALLVTADLAPGDLDDLIRRTAGNQDPDGAIEFARFALAGHAYDAALELAQRGQGRAEPGH